MQFPCPETSVPNYRSTLRNIPEERRSHSYRGGSLKSRTQVRRNESSIGIYRRNARLQYEGLG